MFITKLLVAKAVGSARGVCRSGADTGRKGLGRVGLGRVG